MSDLIQPLTFALIGLSFALIGLSIAVAHVAYVLHVISRGAYSLGEGKP